MQTFRVTVYIGTLLAVLTIASWLAPPASALTFGLPGIFQISIFENRAKNDQVAVRTPQATAPSTNTPGYNYIVNPPLTTATKQKSTWGQSYRLIY